MLKRLSCTFPVLLAAMTLACGGGGGGGGGSTNIVAPVAAPSITRFTAAKSAITAHDSTTLTAVFTNGTGEVDKNVGPVTSGMSITVNPGVTTTYILTVTNDQGATVTSAATITVVGAPSINNFTATKSAITPGESATLTAVFANGTGVVDWSVGAVTSGTPVTVTPATTTTYTLTVANVLGVTVTSTATITVAPTVAITASQTDYIMGTDRGPIHLQAVVTGGSSNTVSWKPSYFGQFSGTGNEVDFLINPGSEEINWSFLLTAVSDDDPSISADIKITINPVHHFSVYPSLIISRTNEAPVINVKANGLNTSLYSIQNLDGSPFVVPGTAGDYPLRIVSTSDSKFSKIIMIKYIDPSAGTQLSGIISSDTTLSPGLSPYYISSGIQIEDGVSLIILPGTVVRGGKINLFGGKIIAIGQQANKIIFDNVNIAPHDSASSSTLDIQLEYVEYMGGKFMNGEGANFGYSSISFDYCDFHEVTGFSLAYPNALTIRHSRFFQGSGIDLGVQNSASIENNLFWGVNSDSSATSAICCWMARGNPLQVKMNTFKYISMLSSPYMLAIPNGYPGKIDAGFNYWIIGTGKTIDNLILDQNDTTEIQSIINYDPVLAMPDPSTPVLD